MKFLIIILILIMSLSVGCYITPVDPDPTPNPDIVCEGGSYSVYYQEWSTTGCEGEWQDKGTYWYNADGRVFLISTETPFDPDSATELQDTFGECPTDYIEEIFL